MIDYQTSELEESFVIRFGTEHSRINAYTLATSLVALADAAKSANAAINPGFEIEVVVESLGAGSFKAKLKAVYRASGNLFSGGAVQAIVLNVIANYIYQHTLGKDVEPNIQVLTDEVIVEAGEKTVVVPRIVYDSCRSVERLSAFSGNVGKAFQAVDRDKDVKFFEIRSISEDELQEDPPISVPRENFAVLSSSVVSELEDTRELLETTDLQIIRAILEKGKRKWEFAWKGVRISAPLTDEKFFQNFSERKFTVAPGDGLEVTLKITQKLNHEAGLYINSAYEVVRVLKHLPRYHQSEIE